jgi:predicted  nucleic acid-binding Zn-ribbon protein
MTDNPFLVFVDFVESDRLYAAAVQKNARYMQEMMAIQNNIAAKEEQINQLRTRVHAIKKEVDAQDLEVRALRSQEHEKQIKLALVTVPREYLSLQQELKLLGQKIDTYENNLMQKWQDFEDLNQQLAQHKEQFEQERQKLSVVLREKEQILAVLDREIEQLAQERELKEQQLLPEWRETYHVMKERVPNPAVPVVAGACSACFYPLSPNDLTAIRRHKIVQCKDCYRLLYAV